MAFAKVITFSPAEAGYWATQSHDSDAVLHQATGLLGWSQARMEFSRSVPAGLVEDRAMCTLSFCKIVGGNEFAYVPTLELGTIEAQLRDYFWVNVKALVSTQVRLIAITWHHYNADLPRDESGRGLKPGPAVLSTSYSLPGTSASGRQVDQVASTITWRTTSRRHWGRIYVPGLTVAALDTTYGRFTNTVVDTLSAAAVALHDTLKTAGYQLVVASQLHPGVLTPTAIEVDDIPDIQRRRRAKRPNYRKIV